jgi:uncharacterized membrane protein (DUF2068 family)
VPPRAHEPPAAAPLDAGVRVIVAYKAVKALGEVALLAGLLLLARGGERSALQEVAALARHHLTSRWSELAARALSALWSGHGFRLLELGLLLDAALTAVEGWSLWRGLRWGPWLVVGATLLPLPWELWEIARTGSLARVAVAAVNLVVTAYLARAIVRERR